MKRTFDLDIPGSSLFIMDCSMTLPCWMSTRYTRGIFRVPSARFAQPVIILEIKIEKAISNMILFNRNSKCKNQHAAPEMSDCIAM